MELRPIDKDEAARYMGVNGAPDGAVLELLDRVEPIVRRTVRPNYVYIVTDISFEDTVAEVALVYFAKVIIAHKRVERFKRIIPSRFVIHVNDLLVETLEREKRSQYESYRDRYRDKAQRKTKADFFIHIIISSLETARIGEMRTDS